MVNNLVYQEEHKKENFGILKNLQKILKCFVACLFRHFYACLYESMSSRSGQNKS